VQNYSALLSNILTGVLDLAREHQNGRVSEQITSVSFTENWFRTSGLYDLKSQHPAVLDGCCDVIKKSESRIIYRHRTRRSSTGVVTGASDRLQIAEGVVDDFRCWGVQVGFDRRE
jgi:hypothetical protein